uniref:Uncharacterized protein n=1 Tax=Noctiluca scintillans TaxID=2966 RepID=A0A7S1F2T8_NOCSC|mmetsp:Transcript_27756/g.73299  ORF Transcript_27756/g.73299 Transcript_27756/m.73299 type:complete len:113 (+) Transcript_27756:49-387(+)
MTSGSAAAWKPTPETESWKSWVPAKTPGAEEAEDMAAETVDATRKAEALAVEAIRFAKEGNLAKARELHAQSDELARSAQATAAKTADAASVARQATALASSELQACAPTVK